MRRNLWTRSALVATAGVAVAVARAADPGMAPAVGVPAAAVPTTAGFRAALLAAGTAAADREEAARRLAAGGTPDDAAAVRDALRTGGPVAQATAARAVSATTDPDPSWVDPLAGLLGPNRPVADAAVAGLADYADTASGDRAWAALRQFADGPAPPLSRGPAVRAMAGFRNRAAAEYLVRAVNGGTPGSTNQTIQRAAAEALAEMTGEADRGANAGLWQQWYAGHANDSPAVWQAYLGGVAARGAAAARVRQAQAADEVDHLLQDAYYRAADAGKNELLLQYLQARSAAVRATGARLTGREVGNRPLPERVLSRVRVLVSDDDPDVRLAAIGVVQGSVDAAAGPFLARQLAREREVPILVRLAQALDKLQDPDAGGTLVGLLGDPRPAVTAAAARALAGLGPTLRRQRPRTAADAGVALRRVVTAQPPAAGPGGTELRAACLNALASLGDPAAFATFRDMLAPDEPADVRRAALDGFGTLADPRADRIVAEALKDDDRTVRLAAARALRTVGRADQLDQLAVVLQQENEADIREAAWQAMVHQFDAGSVDLLQYWVDRFPNDPARRLTVQQDYGRALAAAGDARAVAADDQGVADTLRELKRYPDAVAAMQRAVEFYAHQAPLETNLVGQMLDLQLLARQYTAAAAFAGQQLARPDGVNDYEQLVGGKFRDEADRLKQAGRTDDANALIDAGTSIRPPLEGRYVDELNRDRTP